MKEDFLISNTEFILNLFKSYSTDPNSVSAEWQEFFRDFHQDKNYQLSPFTQNLLNQCSSMNLEDYFDKKTDKQSITSEKAKVIKETASTPAQADDTFLELSILSQIIIIAIGMANIHAPISFCFQLRISISSTLSSFIWA